MTIDQLPRARGPGHAIVNCGHTKLYEINISIFLAAETLKKNFSLTVASEVHTPARHSSSWASLRSQSLYDDKEYQSNIYGERELGIIE